jgi:hypothetical protein
MTQPDRPRVRRHVASGFARRGLLGAVAAATVIAGLSAPATAGSPVAAGAVTDPYGFSVPVAASVYQGDLFVANETNSSVTEVNASTGALVARLTSAGYGFNRPTAILTSGADVFVANGGGNTLTEFVGSTRALVRRISGTAYRFSEPVGLATTAGHLFVLNKGGSVTELSTATGALMGVAVGTNYGFDHPVGIGIIGLDVYVTNPGANSVTEMSAVTRLFVARRSGSTYGFAQPTGIAASSTGAWITNAAGGSVTLISATGAPVTRIVNSNLPAPAAIIQGDGYTFVASPTGYYPMVTQITTATQAVTWMMCNSNGAYHFANPFALAIYGSDLWVVNAAGNSLTEMDADTGALLRTVT